MNTEPKLDFTRPIIAVLILALLVMAFGWLHSCESKKDIVQQADVTQWRTRIERLQADSIAARARQDSILAKRSKDEANWKSRENGLKIENRNLDRKLAQARVTIAPVIDSMPQVKRYADLADSTIAARDSTINAFGMRMRAMEVSHRDEVRELGKKHVAAVGLSQEYAGRVAELESKLRKSERRRKFNRTVMLIMTGGLATVILLNQ
jgi:heme exporter protein D